jgi:hypothetical protein
VILFYLRLSPVVKPAPELTVGVKVAHVSTVLPARHIPNTFHIIAPNVKPVNGTVLPVTQGHVFGSQTASADEAAKKEKDPQG